jgi:hypothetical protein
MKSIIKYLAIVAVFGLVAGSAYADQRYRITLSSVSKIGNTEFKPGEYKMVVEAPKVRFTHLNTGKEVELAAKVVQAVEKNEHTTIHSKSVDGFAQISEIRIGGSKTRIAFD